MDKLSNKIILELQHGAKASGKGTGYICSFDDPWDMTDTTISALSTRIGENTEDVRAAVRYLKTEGYIEYSYLNSKLEGKKEIGFHLSHKGTIYEDIQKKEVEEERRRKAEVESIRAIAAAATDQAKLANEESERARIAAKMAQRRSTISTVISVLSVLIALAALIFQIVAKFLPTS